MSKFIQLTLDSDGRKSLVNTSHIVAVLQVPDQHDNSNIITISGDQTIVRESFMQVKNLLEVADDV